LAKPEGSEVPSASIEALLPDLDRLAADAMADWKVPGVALAVVQDGQPMLTRAYGQRDVEADLPMTPATHLVICSITKSFTASAIALLHGEGRLDWTKPVRDYLPEFRLSDPVATDRVTVQDLLCHRYGLPRHDWVHLPGDRSPAELLAPMRHLELSRDIRTDWQYSNLGYNALGLLIARVSGQSYESFIRTRLTDRIGMTVSFSLDELEATEGAARCYMIDVDTRLPGLRLPIRTMAAGAINTSAADLARWMRLHLGKGEIDGTRLLPIAAMNEILVPRVHVGASEHTEFAHGHYCLGFQSNTYRGDRLVWHGGGWNGWGHLMTLVPEHGIGVVVLTNRSPSQVPPALTWYIIDRLRGREAVDWRARFRKERDAFIAHMQTDKDARETSRHKNTTPAHALSDYAADYEHPAYGTISIRERDGALQWSWRGMAATLVHRHYETFQIPEAVGRLMPDNLPLTFLTDRDGSLVSLSAPLEPMVKDIVFTRQASGECLDPAFRARCVGQFKSGAAMHRVTLDPQGQLVLKPDHQPAYRLEPLQGRRFRIVELEGFVVEFREQGSDVSEIVFHQPNGTFVAARVADDDAATPQD
jgi:CubicO group peptidase (beta-lactamase class C family)